MAGAFAIELLNETKTSVDEAELTAHLAVILRRLGLADNLKLEVVIVGDQKIQTLNKKFLGHDYPTDVLSFPVEAVEAEPSLAGSLVISVETASRQAQQGGITLITELKMLAGHGLLHLLGYHHR